ncbi:hypothetical protein DAI22_01g064900 [Oryza sativa Japonica Group]|jgi:hypothetical protein|nr:hypothetical protein DAI22_01g064900 [Oryza sativa Japonica Group]
MLHHVIAGKELKCYFHSHPQIPNVPNWSVDGIISHAKVNHTKPTTRGPTAVLYANKSICRLLMGDGEGALSDGDAE